MRLRSLLAGVALMACSEGSSGPSTPRVHTMTGTLGTGAWAASIIDVDTPGGALVISGLSANQIRVVLSLEGVPLTNTEIEAPITITLSADAAPIVGFASLSQFAAAAWSTTIAGSSGTVTLTAASNARVTGTFSFIGFPVPGTGAETSTSVTNGKFDIHLQ